VTDGFLKFIGGVVTVNVKTVGSDKTHDFLMVVVCINDSDGVAFVCFSYYCSVDSELFFD
jgi:hypothetical protein